MNPTQLLAHFDRISEAPDAVARLRRFILDLAVRGKLVEQEPSDEPAAELLKRIQAEKALQVKGKPLTSVDAVETPFSAPAQWVWVRLGEICSKTGSGSTPKGGKEAYRSSGIPFLRSQNVHDDGLRLDSVAYIDEETHQRMRGTAICPGDLLLNITGGSIGRCARVPNNFSGGNISQHVAILRLAFRELNDFTHLVILSSGFQNEIFHSQTGAGREGLPKNRMDEILIPLPPLAEQHRIVAKVDELMTLCDELAAAQNEREVRRDQLVAASLNRIGTAPAATDENVTENQTATSLHDATCFHLNHLPRLTTRPEHIKQLRQTILNLAVCGHLVAQDPSDEPAAELLKRIAGKKTTIGRTIPKLPNNSGLPAGWVSVDLSDYALDVCTGPFGSALHQSDYVNGGIPLVNPSHMVNDRIISNEMISVPLNIAERLSSYRLEPGDIVMARRGEVGRAALVESHQQGWLCGTGSFYLRFSQEINRHYFLLVLRSAPLRSYLAGKAVGTTMVNLNHNILNKARLAIPPLAEQQRIVARVDELMALCDQLETQLTTTQTDSRRLLEAVLRDALEISAVATG